MQLAAFALLSLMHRGHGSQFTVGTLLCVPVGLLGTWLGMGWFRRMSNRQFTLVVNWFLILSGLSFVF